MKPASNDTTATQPEIIERETLNSRARIRQDKFSSTLSLACFKPVEVKTVKA